MNPVLVNDLRKSLIRRKPVHVAAYMALAILALVFLVAAFVPVSTGGPQGGIMPLWRYPDLLLPLVAPAFAAGAFAKEHEQRTWQDVLLTRLSGGEILRGKLLACIVPVLVTLVVLFPAFLLALIVQNVQWAMDAGPWMAIWGAKLLVCVLFYVAASLVCSYFSPNARVALVITYAAFVTYAVLNYTVWRFAIEPAFYSDVIVSVPYGAYNTYSGAGPFLGSDARQFDLAPVDWLMLIQSAVVGAGLLMFLAIRLRRRRA